MKLYEIVEEMEKCIDPETGEVDTERLTELQKEKDEKLEGVALWILDLTNDITAIKAEKARLDERKAAAERKIESLKVWLAYALNGEKLKSPRVTVSYRKSKSVVIDNVDRIPEEFITIKTEKVPDKTALKQAFGEWQLIDGCHLEERTTLQVH